MFRFIIENYTKIKLIPNNIIGLNFVIFLFSQAVSVAMSFSKNSIKISIS